MIDVFRKGKVYIQKKYAGIISENDKGYSFTYDEKYLNSGSALPVSITLPLQSEPYHSNVLFPFFDGLIPEGWLLDVATHNWKIDSNDRFGLLLLVCRDCIGDVKIMEVESDDLQ